MNSLRFAQLPLTFLSGVNFHVSPQVIGHGEGLCTLGAGVRPFATVCPLVPIQISYLGKILFTLVAWIWFFSGVNSHLFAQSS